jgi:dipeptidase
MSTKKNQNKIIHIRDDLEHGKLYGQIIFVDKMLPFLNQVSEIDEVVDENCFKIKNCEFYWSKEMFVEK